MQIVSECVGVGLLYGRFECDETENFLTWGWLHGCYGHFIGQRPIVALELQPPRHPSIPQVPRYGVRHLACFSLPSLPR
jgi:hypothetical protein